MNKTHAPYALLNDLVIMYGKTTKTACGQRQESSKLVKRGEQTCSACAAAIAADRAEYAELERIARSEFGYTGPSATVGEMA